MSCVLCGEQDVTPALLATVGDSVVGCVCDRHGVGADPHADASALINRLLSIVGARHPDELVRIRDAHGRTVLGRNRP
jgi:hypothetical protein